MSLKNDGVVCNHVWSFVDNMEIRQRPGFPYIGYDTPKYVQGYFVACHACRAIGRAPCKGRGLVQDQVEVLMLPWREQ